MQLRQLQQYIDEVSSLDANVYAISNDTPDSY